jgi:nucleotide-binding universal stress UspA family protein
MILVGTDLSIASRPAMLAAAAVARKQGEDLILATVLENPAAGAHIMADVRLEQDAAELRRDFELTVECVVLEGAPDEKLLRLAEERAASLVVVGAEGSSKRARRVGSVAERLCQLSKVPVLVARDADQLVSWSRGSAQLRVLVGSGLGDASKCALSLVAAWPDLVLTVAHVAWPYGEHYRLGTSGPMPLDHLRPEVHHQLLGDLGRWASDVPCQAAPRLSVTPGWGRVDAHLAQLAHEKEADLLVLGNHQRNFSERLWHGSVSRNALHEAGCNVLCVPQKLLESAGTEPRVLVVPTDFSVLADRAVRVAYSLLPRGGAVHLVFVATDKDHDASSSERQLAARVPTDAERRGVSTELRVLEGDAAWLAIWQYASRVSADLICMATHSRDAVSSLLLGSQAQALLQHSRIPVLLVPPDRES